MFSRCLLINLFRPAAATRGVQHAAIEPKMLLRKLRVGDRERHGYLSDFDVRFGSFATGVEPAASPGMVRYAAIATSFRAAHRNVQMCHCGS